ncbi:MAG: hypothetical protein NTZ38_00285 [Candidatus Taylorbacteria bacterium]|nr:hypothetical protein [Candidatus Taylorbacteria bacterium]
MMALSFGYRNLLTVSLSGFGWGLMCDEIIPLLRSPSPGRDYELRVYEESRNSTICLILAVVFMALVTFMIIR